MKHSDNQQYKGIFRFFTMLIIYGLHCGIFAFTWYYYLNPLGPKPFTGKGNILEIAVYILMIIIFMRIFGGNEIGYFTALNVGLSQILSICCVNFIMGIVVVLSLSALEPVKWIYPILLAMTLAQIPVVIVLVLLFDRLYTVIFPAWNMLLVYENESYRNFTDKISKRKDKYIIAETVNVNEGLHYICDRMKKYDAVIIYDISSELRNELIKYCYGQEIRVYQTPKISDILIRSAGEHHLFDTPLITSDNIGLSFEQKLIKRLGDVILSLLMLIITSPVMLVTALLIKLEDGGPVFFTQQRVTYAGRRFTIYKFRSMVTDAEKDGKPRPATENDDRITKIGRFIRKTRIDELPQLINVLKGDMSLVGPRPERVEHVIKYTEEIPEFRYRTKVKGGLTGYAQVYGKYNTTAYDKLKLDLMYIENYSLLLDLRIIVMTLKVLFMKSSTEGFEEKNN